MRIPLTLLLIASCGIASANPTGSGVTMIMVGSFFPDDVPAVSPGRWHALCPTPSGIVLKSTAVKVRTVPDPDAIESSSASRVVEATGCPDTIALLRGTFFKDGQLATAIAGDVPVSSDVKTGVLFNKSLYFLQARPPDRDHPMDVFLEKGGLRQQIGVVEACCNDAGPSIIWAGNLDRDGKLDLLMSLTGHYAGPVMALFLSSKAGKNELVREVARFAWSSC